MKILKSLKVARRRFDIEQDTNPKEQFIRFRNRILNRFEGIDVFISQEGIRIFSDILGIRERFVETPLLEGPPRPTIIGDTLKETTNEKKFYYILQIIFFLPFEKQGWLDLCFNSLKGAIEFSDVNLSVTRSGKNIILLPKGEPLLNDSLIEKPLDSLNDKSAVHFTKALKNFNNSQLIDSIDDIRRCLEEFLRYKLNNTDSLQVNIKKLQQALKTAPSDADIRGIIQKIFSYLDSFFNENSKHHDGEIGEAENEFSIYQVGLLIRYINQVIT